MNEHSIAIGSLVIYKRRPARVERCGERLEIKLEGGNLAKVREKDVIFLHPGPMQSLDELHPQQGELELAWEILSEDPQTEHNIIELAELIFGDYTPANAWGAWKHVEDGLYFRGNPEALFARSSEQVSMEQAKRQRKSAESKAWEDFLERARNGQIHVEKDTKYIRETEDLAFGRRKNSRLLRELGHNERPENAQQLLINCHYWDETVNPHPVRLGISSTAPNIALPPLPNEERLDLTYLQSFAIDDRNNQDPDDAISLEDCQFDGNGALLEGSLWVHIADAAALIPPDSPVDLEARARGATLYLPEGPIPMLPANTIQRLGLGLDEVSPALSFKLMINGSGELLNFEFKPSWVKVQRISYEDAEKQLNATPFQELLLISNAYQARRNANGALFIDMPEVIIQVRGRTVDIRPVLRLRSRDLVREAMLMTGEAAAKYAIQHQIPFPFVTQSAPDVSENEPLTIESMKMTEEQARVPDYASFYLMRRKLKRSQVSGLPAPHAGIGLAEYSRVTSPLRRYSDLVAHQQLRAYLKGVSIIKESDLLERVGSSEAMNGILNKAEFQSRRHWTLVYLIQHEGLEIDGILIDRKELRGRVLIPNLALEVSVHLRREETLNSPLRLKLRGVNLPELEAHFEVLTG